MAEDPNRIEPRSGLEVFLNKAGLISIAQVEANTVPADEPSVVVVHPGDVPRLIEMLKRVAREATEPEESGTLLIRGEQN